MAQSRFTRNRIGGDQRGRPFAGLVVAFAYRIRVLYDLHDGMGTGTGGNSQADQMGGLRAVLVGRACF